MKEDLSEFEIKEPYDPPEMKATIDELQAAKIPREYRDFCAHLLIPLNQCRRESFFLPWKCHAEEHKYELCQYAQYKRRLLKQAYLKKQQESE